MGAEDMSREQGMAHLLADGNLAVPGGRYGSDTAACAPVAWRLAEIVADANGEPITRQALDFAMGLVVNSHDDVEDLFRSYGTAEDLELADLPAISDARMEELKAQAHELGRQAGVAAGSWAADGNTDAEHARRVLAGIEDGDPIIMDSLPVAPDLSGEWADGMTPARLALALGLTDDATGAVLPEDESGDILAELCDAWEESASEGCQQEAERVLRIAAAAVLRVELAEAGDVDALREIAAEWHGGQWSALYAFASSGTVLAGASSEPARDLRSTRSDNVLGRRELAALRDFLETHEPGEEGGDDA